MSQLRWPIGALVWVVVATQAIALLVPVSVSGAPAGRVGSWFLFGANMPWLSWNADFGGGPNGGGVSGNIATLDSKLQAAQAAGMHNVRWWVFEGGSPQIQRDASGTPTGLNANVYTDLDAALMEAAKYDISYNFVLFGGTNDDATSHQWWEDSAKRQALVAVLQPLFQRYASNPRAHTWELVNEPEWQSRNGQTSVAGMLATGDALANAVHQNSPALVTVGHAQVQDMQTWAGHPLDYYSPHYYDNFGTGSNDPFLNPASSPDGKPVVIGEFPASAGLNPDAQSRWQALYSNGYAGGWNWSMSPENTGDKIATDWNAAAAFARGKSDLGPQLSGAAPTATSTATPVPPTATPTATPVPPTATSTATAVPPTATSTATAVPPTATSTATAASPTPTRVPSTATPTPSPKATWTLRSNASPSTVPRGSFIQVNSHITVNRSTRALVDVEIYDQNWNKVYQRFWDNQSFIANQARSFNTTWSIPVGASPGRYTVMVGTFGPGWTGVDSFNNSAATFQVL